MNNVKTFVLMAGLMGLFLLAGQLLGGSQGLMMALVFGGVLNFIMYFFSDKLVLRMYGAKVVSEAEAPELYRMVDRLRQRAGLPMPVVAVAPHEQPNAFATGRNPEHAVVAVTTGILKYMPQDELEGVIAHELAHVKNRDMLISTIAAGHRRRHRQSPLPADVRVGGATTTGTRSPRSRLVARADRGDADPVRGFAPAGVRGRPGRRRDPGPADAAGERAPAARRAGAPDPDARGAGGGAAGAGQPAGRERRRVCKLFSTHPPTEERVARLEAMTRAARWAITGWRSGSALPAWSWLAGPRPGRAQPPVARAVVQGGDELERRAHRLALGFGLFLWWREGGQHALEYYTGYLIELSLSVDNLFVFILIFNYFGVPAAAQPKVLKWGILGAIVMRWVMIVFGALLLARFEWIIYVFGGILILTGIRMLTQKDERVDLEKNPVVRLARRVLPFSQSYDGGDFFCRTGTGRRLATPLLLVLIVVEWSDLVFAIDSIPAIFAVTRDPFLVYSSNVFAILGLRALFFVLAGMMDRFAYLKPGVALILVFVGARWR